MEHKEIALIGKITAGMTHEMKNVLAIIKESQGLMQDILSLSKKIALPHQDKFFNALEKIQKNVGRGVEMMTQFNRFAHIMDEESATIDGSEFVTLVVFLYQRFARQKQVKLLAETTENKISIVNVPIRLLLALITCLDNFLDQAVAQDTITLGAVQTDGKVSFQFINHREQPDRNEQHSPVAELTDLAPVLRALSGELQILERRGVTGFSLVLPIKKDIP